MKTLKVAMCVATIAFVAGCSGSAVPPTSQLSAYSPSDKNGSGAPPEIWNAFEAAPSGQTPTDFEVTFAGDQVNNISTGALTSPYNPFCPPSDSSGCSPSVTYNSSNNTTTVEYSGTLYENEPPSASCYPCYHFGLFGESTLMENAATTEWTYPSTHPLPWWFVNVSSSKMVAKAKDWAYAEVYIDVALSKGGSAVFGSWQEIGYVPKGNNQPRFKFANYGTKPLYVLSSGVILNQPVPTDPSCQKNPSCPEDMQILASLNFGGSPPPGFPSSKFVKLQYPPPSVLKPQK